MSNDPCVAGLPNTPAPVICEFCGAERYTEGMKLPGIKVFWYPGGANPCTCQEGLAQYELEQAQHEARIEAEKQAEKDRKLHNSVWQLVRKSGIGERFKQRTFENYVVSTPEQEKILSIAQNYVRNFSRHFPRPGKLPQGRNGIYIVGNVGVGKTHIAAAVANELINAGIPAICMTEGCLLREIKSTYSSNQGNENMVYEIYQRIPLLVIDDLGKEKATDWSLSTLYSIIDKRYEMNLPIIITSNYDPKKLIARLTPKLRDGTLGDTMTTRAIIDRLMEMCESFVMTGESQRSR